uniref:Uncharacterized protein n=1 Tax=Caenorhabditis japonica TaxID=281687 RepID=A0A8R1EKI5_CAEJA
MVNFHVIVKHIGNAHLAVRPPVDVIVNLIVNVDLVVKFIVTHIGNANLAIEPLVKVIVKRMFNLELIANFNLIVKLMVPDQDIG